MIRIEPITDHERYRINGKEVYKDASDNWIATQELTQQEQHDFANYKTSIIDNKAVKRHTKANF